jgi:hypothetical protein
VKIMRRSFRKLIPTERGTEKSIKTWRFSREAALFESPTQKCQEVKSQISEPLQDIQELPHLFHDLLQNFRSRPYYRRRQRSQRLLRNVQQIKERGHFGIDVEHAGQHLALFLRLI